MNPTPVPTTAAVRYAKLRTTDRRCGRGFPEIARATCFGGNSHGMALEGTFRLETLGRDRIPNWQVFVRFGCFSRVADAKL